MRRFSALLVLLFAAAQFVWAGERDVAGTWKLTYVDGDRLVTFWFLTLEKKDGKWTGKAVSTPTAPPATVESVQLQNDNLRINLELALVSMKLSLQFKVPAGEAKKLHGVIAHDQGAIAAELVRAKAGDAEKTDVVKEVQPIKDESFALLKKAIADTQGEMATFAYAQQLVGLATVERADLAELKSALAPALAAAARHGPDWVREVRLGLAYGLSKQNTSAALGEELARLALKEMKAETDIELYLRAQTILADAVRLQNKTAELAKIQESITDLEVKGHEANEKAGPGFKADKSEPRKGNRAVLVELFTGAQCGPCVAADLAFEGLARSHQGNGVQLLQYHMHIPRPDPLTIEDAEKRANYYENGFKGTPTIFFNGKADEGGGGSKNAAGWKYDQYRKIIEPMLAAKTDIQLTVEATKTGDEIRATAKATGFKASEKLRLRLALVEPWVRYAGSNGVIYHVHVVRALLGGPDGFDPAKKNGTAAAKINLRAWRDQTDHFLEQYRSLDGQRPFFLRNLRVVAFLQDDATREVLQAADTAVK
jgi:hypothetical protein